VTYTLYVWKRPRVTDPDEAAALLERWDESGDDAADRPFEATTDVHWFLVELRNDLPELDATSDQEHAHPIKKLWWLDDPGPVDRVVTMQLAPETPQDAIATIASLAMKYDLVLFDPQRRSAHLPMEEMAAHASATFWPRGAIQAFVAGALGGLAAVIAWLLGIPIVSGIMVIVGAFMLVMAMFTFVHEGRKRLGSSHSGEAEAGRG
jgi:hypothetical protein